MSSKVLEVKDLSFNYEKEFTLKDINFKINCGEYVGIVGENGSGKSTLLNLMLGNLSPSHGYVDLCEKRIGYLSQQVRSFNKKFPATVEEVIAANLYSEMGLFKILNKKHREKIKEVLHIVGMTNYKNKLIGNLSGGQQQRVFLARLLVSNPRVIFMDEPIVGLDDESIKSFYELMDKLHKELGLTIVMVTHDIKTIEGKADKMIYLKDTRIRVEDLRKNQQIDKINKKQEGQFIKI